MSNLKDRAAARLFLVPEPIAVSYAAAMARLPRARIEICLRSGRSADAKLV